MSKVKKIKKPKLPSTSTLKTKLWEHVKQFTRARGNTCYTCQKGGLEGSNHQSGHMIPSGACGAILRYHPSNIRPQCYSCNINYGGQGAEFLRRMTIEIGQEKVDKLFQLKQKSIKADVLFYMKLIELYTAKDEQAIVNYLESLV